MAQPVIHSSFAGGEISTNLFARVDLDKYHVGAALMRNFFVDYRGGASTRPGTQLVGRATAKLAGSGYGYDWTAEPPANGNDWEGVAWSGTRFVAVASNAALGDQFMSSPDGVAWTAHVAPAALAWEDVCYSPDLAKFVAVAANSTLAVNGVAYSSDGLSWLGVAAASDNDWLAVCWAKELGQFFAVGAPNANPNIVMRSADATTWIAGAGATAYEFRGICWSAELGLLVAVAHSGTADAVMTSPDGVTWTSRATPSVYLNAVAWSPELSLFVAVGLVSLITSPDGVNWTSQAPIAIQARSVCWSVELGVFTAVGDAGVATSPDGITWTLRSAPNTDTWTSVAWAPEINTFAAVANSGTPNRVMISVNNGVDPENGTRVQLKAFEVSSVEGYLLLFTAGRLRFVIGTEFLSDQQFNILGCTRANPGVITLNGPIVSGKSFTVADVVGMKQLNNRTFVARNPVGNTCELYDEDGNPVNTSAFTAYASGGTADQIQEMSTPYVDADIGDLKFTQSADVLTIVNSNYTPHELRRTDANTFTLVEVSFGAQIIPPSGLTATPSDTSGTKKVRYGYTVTAVSAESGEESVAAKYATASCAPLDPNAAPPQIIKIKWTGVSGAEYYKIYKWGPINEAPAPNGPDNTVFGYIGSSFSTSFTDANKAPDYTENPPEHFDPFAPGQILSMRLLAPTGSFAGATSYRAMTIVGDGVGAEGYALTDPEDGTLAATILTAGGRYYTLASLTFSGGQSATVECTFAPLTGVRPSCAAYLQQRRLYAATPNGPGTIFMSAVGNYSNFDKSLFAVGDSAIIITLASREVNEIKSLVPMQTGLVVLTSGGAFLLSGGGQAAAITPTNVSALPEAATGANDMVPIVINYDILFVSAKSTTVRDLAYNFYTQSYYGFDRSTLASHLFTGHKLKNWCYAEDPFRLVWAVRNDGKALCMTYVPEQEIYGWSQHDTQGVFRNVERISTSATDNVYFIVTRFGKKYIERLAKRAFSNVAQDYCCVDSALSAHFDTPTSVVGGLWHLVGQTVTGLADGQVIPPRVVDANGEITLVAAASDVIVGLSFVAQLQTLYLDMGDPTIQAKYKLITGMTARVENTLGLSAGPDFDSLFPFKTVKALPFTPPVPLYTGDDRMLMSQQWNTYGQVCIQQDQPLPATVLGLIPEVALGSTQR